MKGYPVGTRVQLHAAKGDCYDKAIATVVSTPFNEEDCNGYFIGFQRIKFDPPVITGERTIYYDIVHPSTFRAL